MNSSTRASIEVSVVLAGFAAWLAFERWSLLNVRDLMIIMGIALFSAIGLGVVLIAMNASANVRLLLKGWKRIVIVPLVGGLAWFIFMVFIMNAAIEIAIALSIEHRFNNAIQFLRSRTDFMQIVLLSMFAFELILRDRFSMR